MNKLPKIWLGLWICLVTGLTLTLVFRPLDIQSNLLAALPGGQSSPLQHRVVGQLLNSSTNRFNILFGAGDLSAAITAGNYFAGQLPAYAVDFELTGADSRILTLLAQHNYLWLAGETKAQILHGDFAGIAAQAYTLLLSPVRAGLLPFSQDPFMLMPRFLLEIVPGHSGFTLDRGVLSARQDDLNYAYLTVRLPDNVPLDAVFQAAAAVQKARDAALSVFPEVRINISGVPLHTVYAARQSIREINIILTISTLLIILLSGIVFRSLTGLLAAVLNIGSSILVALLATNFVFGQIHILTLTFGATLLGLAVDYHIHYFVALKTSGKGEDIIRKIGRSCTLCLGTTLGGFAVLFLSDIALVRAMAFFALCGLCHAYFIIMGIYPLLFKPAQPRPQSPIAVWDAWLVGRITAFFSRHAYLKIAVLLGLAAGGIAKSNYSDEIKNIYSAPADLLKAEALFAKISGYASAPLYILVAGEDAEDAAQKEEAVCIILEQNKVPYQAITQLVPSRKQQAANWQLNSVLLKNTLPLLSAYVGLDRAGQAEISRKLNAQEKQYIQLADLAAIPAFAALADFQITDREKVYRLILQTRPQKINLPEDLNAAYLDPLADASLALRQARLKSTVALFMLLAGIFILVSLVLKSYKKGFWLTLPSLLALAICWGVLGFAGVKLSLFHILAMFLVICIGIDYAVFRLHSRGFTEGVPTAFLTTLASFALLAFTSFSITRAIGVTLAIGILASYLLSPLAARAADTEKPL
ncbi:MAG: hypothetical protein LBQ83_01465 [Candidatus Margulisbacteria bacterium]|nr:hypothetical protein [Candidatus Margulisiibacteriota bacterium]